MFYYLQDATWEPTYSPTYKTMTLAQYAQRTGGENNYMVRKIVGKRYNAVIGDDDLEMAKTIVKEKFIVGIMEEFEESVHRFSALLDIDETTYDNKECFDKYAIKEQKATQEERKEVNREFAKDRRQTAAKQLRRAADGKNSNAHPDIEEKSPAWDAIAKKNVHDLKFYQFVRALFDEQKTMFEEGGVHFKSRELDEDYGDDDKSMRLLFSLEV